MMTKVKFAVLCIAALASVQAPAMAQGIECGGNPAEIITLRAPVFDAPASWDTLYAKEGMDVFTDAKASDKDSLVAGGAYTKDKEDKLYHPLLVKFDEKRKIVWETREDSKEQKLIQRMLKDKDGFAVLGDWKDGVYIARYDGNGKKIAKDMPVTEKGGELDAKGFQFSQDGTGYIVAAQFIKGSDTERQNGILYKISKSGKVVWKRVFTTGQSTVFNNVQTALDKTYLVTGQVVLDGGISAALVLSVDENGALRWQRNYPRGNAAAFMSAAQTKGGDLVLTGKARPRSGRGDALAAWIMKTDKSGEPLWQRYFKGDYSYEAADAIVYEDGRASVLLNARGQKSDQRSHARLLTFSPQGAVQKMESFTDGQNASAARLTAGPAGERILVGYAQTGLGDESTSASDVPVSTFDAWLAAAPPLDLFDDPCAPPPTLSPILQ